MSNRNDRERDLLRAEHNCLAWSAAVYEANEIAESLEALKVALGRKAKAHGIALPAHNEVEP